MKKRSMLAVAVWMSLPQTAGAMTCQEILGRVGRGDGVSDVVAQMVRDGAMNAATVRCLVDGGAPAAIVAAANGMIPAAALAPSRAPSAGAAPPAVSPRPPPMPAPRAVSAPMRPSRAPPAEPVTAAASVPLAPPPPTPPSHVTDDGPVWQGSLDPSVSETWTDHGVSPFRVTAEDALSTFAADVDSGSYTNARRKLREGFLPPPAAVRTEEFVNYLPYEYGPSPDGAPFGVTVEAAPTPWRDTWTVAVGIQGKKLSYDTRSPVHLTFLIDTSGSMASPDKMGLVKQSLAMLVNELEDGDTVALVAYAGSAGLVLPHTPTSRRGDILTALERLEAGGSTAMGSGITLAYAEAERVYRDGAVNRVILASDGDANVGPTDPTALSRLIAAHAEHGITLTTLGFGDGNYRDTTMEQIADDGDGNYFYIDSEQEAERILVDKLTSTLEVIAKDVKIQVAWDPETVSRYRLVGYENRDVADRDFRDDRVDGGEIGAGHQVTALYEIERTGAPGPLGEVRIRSMAPGPDSPAVERRTTLAPAAPEDIGAASRQFRMAVASATFAEILRASPYAEDTTLQRVLRLAEGAVRVEYPEDRELVDLVRKAMVLRGEQTAAR